MNSITGKTRIKWTKHERLLVVSALYDLSVDGRGADWTDRIDIAQNRVLIPARHRPRVSLHGDVYPFLFQMGCKVDPSRKGRRPLCPVAHPPKDYIPVAQRPDYALSELLKTTRGLVPLSAPPEIPLESAPPEPRPEANGKHEKCLVPDCQGLARSKGLCLGCYRIAHYLIKTNKTTWENLEKAGKVLPSAQSKATKAANWFLT